MTDSFKTFVISLERTPERLAEFRQWNAAALPTFSVFAAFDGKTVPRAQAVAAGVIGPTTDGFTPGAIGGAMSHSALWRRCADERQPILVFEDDAVLRSDFSERLSEIVAAAGEGWDIIRLGYNCDSVIDIRMTAFCDLRGEFSLASPSKAQLQEFARSRNPVQLFRLNNAFGICAYLISPLGARVLLRRCFPLEKRLIDVPALRAKVMVGGTDYMMNAVYRDIQAYACFPPLVMVANERAASTIQTAPGNVLRQMNPLLARGAPRSR